MRTWILVAATALVAPALLVNATSLPIDSALDGTVVSAAMSGAGAELRTTCNVVPTLVEECGDTMTGALTMSGASANVAFTGGNGVNFPGGLLKGNTQLLYGPNAVCLDGSSVGSCGDVTGVTAGTGLLGGGSSGTVTLSADTNYLQRRVTGSCASGSAIRVINQDGTVACETDDGQVYSGSSPIVVAGTTISLSTVGCSAGFLWKWTGSAWACQPDANSGGTVTSVATGAGLTGGPITTSGTISLAAPTASTLGGVLSATCGYGMVVTAIGTTGNPICTVDDSWYWRTAPRSNTATTIEAVGNINIDATFGVTSTTIGIDGTPVVAYFNAAASTLRFLKCGTPLCNAPALNTLTTVDSGTVGKSPAVAIGTDGLPIISYYDEGGTNLRVVHCGSLSCSPTTLNVITTIDGVSPAVNVGQWTSIAIGTDGNPVIAYYDTTNTNLKVAKCNTVTCAGTPVPTLTTVDSTGDVGRYPNIAIGTDGLPIVSYYDGTGGTGSTNTNLKVAHCGNAACSASNTITNIEPATFSGGRYSGIAIGTDGLPVISYRDDANPGGLFLKVVKCGNRACSSGNTITTVENTGNTGIWTSIAIGADNLPIISYWQANPNVLKVAHCGNPACSSFNAITSIGSGGTFTSIAIGPADGLPFISYHDGTSVRVVHLSNEFGIANLWRRG